MGGKIIKDFKTHTQIELSTPQADHALHALEATQEGLQTDKKNNATLHNNSNRSTTKTQKTTTPQTRHPQSHWI